MAEKTIGLRESLILAGIDEINAFGANGFSVRRVANACSVSSAAPYKHFKDKQEFIAAIIDYVNDQWAVHQDQVLAGCSQDPREQIVTVALSYIRFLMEKPYYRQSAVIFFMIGIVFLFIAAAILLDAFWITYIADAVIVLLLIYAVASSIAIEKRKKRP